MFLILVCSKLPCSFCFILSYLRCLTDFSASCILEFWSYRSSIQPCKCPLCWCKMVNLKPEISLVRATDDTVEVLKKLDQYNGLYVDGVHGFFRVRSVYIFLRLVRVWNAYKDCSIIHCLSCNFAEVICIAAFNRENI